LGWSRYGIVIERERTAKKERILRFAFSIQKKKYGAKPEATVTPSPVTCACTDIIIKNIQNLECDF